MAKDDNGPGALVLGAGALVVFLLLIGGRSGKKERRTPGRGQLYLHLGPRDLTVRLDEMAWKIPTPLTLADLEALDIGPVTLSVTGDAITKDYKLIRAWTEKYGMPILEKQWEVPT